MLSRVTRAGHTNTGRLPPPWRTSAPNLTPTLTLVIYSNPITVNSNVNTNSGYLLVPRTRTRIQVRASDSSLALDYCARYQVSLCVYVCM